MKSRILNLGILQAKGTSFSGKKLSLSKIFNYHIHLSSGPCGELDP